jgi:predicted PurR-regulated permease PerM
MNATSSLNWLRPFVILTGVLIAVAALYFAHAVVVPVVVAALLTFILTPPTNILQRRGVHRVAAALIVSSAAFAFLGGVLAIIGHELQSLAAEIPDHQEEINKKLDWLRGLASNDAFVPLSQMWQGLSQSFGVSAVGIPKELPLLEWVFGPAMQFVVDAGLVIVLVVFMLIQREDLRNRIIRLSGRKNLTSTTKALDDAARRVSKYLLRQALVNIAFGLVVSVGLSILGVPYAVLWGLLGAALRYVPYVGTWLAAVCPVLLSVAVSPGWTQPLLTFLLFVVLDVVVTNVLEPVLYGKSIGVSGTALLIAAAFWTWLWGPIGLLLSTPLTACLVVLGRYVPQLEFLAVLLGDQPALPTHVTFFQRLLARDEDEAEDLIEQYIADHPVEEVYDKVMIPALHIAKENSDRGVLADGDDEFIFEAAQRVLEDVVFPAQEASWKASAEKPESGPAADRVTVFGVPAHDRMDEAAMTMLGRLLPPDKCDVEVLSAKTLASEVLERIASEHPPLVCVGALPPRALAGVRYLCKRLKGQYPDLKIVVGLWGVDEQDPRAIERLRTAGSDAVAASLLEARTLMLPLIQAAAHTRPAAKSERKETLQRVG